VLGDAVVDTALAALRAKLARLDSPGQQLRPVTVLFADVVESTTLSRRLDPEDVHAIMDGALQHFTSIVEAQYGRVLQYAGDGLLAVFGAVEAHEDDPERAVRAGLEILDEAKRLAAQVQARHGYDGFNTRVGIHTGPVLLGGGVDAEGSIRGIAVNIAARMEQSAPSGGLRISHTTYRHVRSAFEVLEEPPILVKGIPDPVRSYVVLGVKAKTFGATNRGVAEDARRCGVETVAVSRELNAHAESSADASPTWRASEESPPPPRAGLCRVARPAAFSAPATAHVPRRRYRSEARRADRRDRGGLPAPRGPGLRSASAAPTG